MTLYTSPSTDNLQLNVMMMYLNCEPVIYNGLSLHLVHKCNTVSLKYVY